jgi:hypothetical protein
MNLKKEHWLKYEYVILVLATNIIFVKYMIKIKSI